jgi:hypothetical protein
MYSEYKEFLLFKQEFLYNYLSQNIEINKSKKNIQDETKNGRLPHGV